MTLLPVRVSKSALQNVAGLFVPEDIPTGSIIELTIEIDDQRLNVREFSAYLALVDRVYGRLSRAGLRSYAQTTYTQLEIAEVRQGSLLLIIQEITEQFKDATPLVILWLFLKYLPDMVKTSADAYKSIEEGRLARDNRKRLKAEIKRDDTLARLDDKTLNQLVKLVNALSSQESRELPAAQRFVEKSVRSVKVNAKRKQ